MKKSTFLIFVLSFLLSSLLHAQKFAGTDAEKVVTGCETVWVNPEKGDIIFIKPKASQSVYESNHVAWIKKSLSLPGGYSFNLVRKESDKSGFTHYRYQLWYNQIPIENAVYYVHIKNGLVNSANGDYPIMEPKVDKVSLSQAVAFDIANKKFNEKKLDYKLQSKPVLTFIENNKAIFLVYKIDMMSASSPRREYIYVNAVSGEIVKVIDRIRTSDVSGTAETKYNGIQPITTDSYSSQYRLRESGRGGGIETYDCNKSTNYYAAVDFTSTTNYWNTTTEQDNAAYDAHYGSEAVYDYYFNKFGRNSYGNSGEKIISYTHYDYYYSNAFWNGSFMTFGDGDQIEYTALTSIDIIAHEFTHGVTEYTANLIYSGESGALNESFSDIFGICVDYYMHPSEANFLMGEQVSLTSTPIRDCQNPNNTGNPDTYQGTFWDPYQEVHANSTVQTYWFYLLTNGGSGTNDIGNSFSVGGIGIEAAEAIAYRNLNVYLTPGSDYNESREYSIQAATDLYGPCSAEVIACTNAWYAVGVGLPFSNLVTSDFAANYVYSCSIPSTINFTSNSLNSSNYQWNFGDGGTSNVQNPEHTYTAVGTYSVSLIVTGSALCGGTTDTLLQPDYITITNSGGPVSSNCSPSTLYSYGYKGITHFKFNTIDNISEGSVAGYEDFTCTSSTVVKEAKKYDLLSTLESGYNNHFKVWLDKNNDGQFSETEVLADSNFYTYTFSKNIKIPYPLENNVPLRLRIGCDEGSYSLSTACSDSYYGQYEDYSLIVQPNTDPPLADFTANSTTIPIGTTVYFSDKSDNVVSSWQWTFQGGSALHSSEQNPAITYSTLGTYQVKLKVTNSYGQDSVTKTEYIKVVNSFNMCSGSNQSTLAAGNLYDSGGPTGNYSDSENCDFLIDNCGTSITLTFSQFQTEGCCDYLRVYDGPDENGILLLTQGGSSIPSPVTAYSGKMYIKFTSDGSVSYAGFSASWTSVIPNGNPPAGDFLISDVNPPLNSPVLFSDNSSEDATSWFWNFGDTNTSAEQNPTHNFQSPGTFQVKLIVHNCFDADTVVKSLEVQAAPSITASPAFFNVNLEACGAGTSEELTIANQSGGDLAYSLSASNSYQAVNILMLMNGVDTYGEGQNTIEALNTYFTDYNLTQATLSNASEIDALLIGKSIVLIPEIENYPGNIYYDIASSLQSFVSDGGSVIFCGTSEYISSVFGTGLLSGYSMGSSFSSTLNLTSEVHPITEGIPSSFEGPNATVYYSISSDNTVSLAKVWSYDAVVYRALGQGKVVLIGFDYYEYNSNSAKILANAVQWCRGGSGPSWISVNPSSGIITAGKDRQVEITFNSENLTGGTYTYDLMLNSNDPLHPNITIPVTLTISNKPCANFGYVEDICTGLLTFKDSSFNNPTSWSWNFGDGFSSVLQNPLHSYTSAGNHTVSLIVCNSSDCDTAYLQVNLASLGGPVAASCNPAGYSYVTGMGIYNVSFNTIHNRTVEDNKNYVDYSCAEHTFLTPGLTYPIIVQCGSSYNENVAVWIDYNNDGEFSSAELVTQGISASSTFTGNITIPITTVQYVPLRMRIGSDYSGSSTLTPCSSNSYGQFEDYTVIIRPVNVPPVANFAYVFLDNCQGIVQFNNQTLNNATSFLWDFGDGGISFQENPIHIYATTGTYKVTLKATNEFGHTEKELNIVATPITATIIAEGILEINQTVTFNTDVVATIYNWDFGDGQNSTLKSPPHQYPVGGTYLVKLNVSNDICSYTTSRSIFIRDPNGIDESGTVNEIAVYPNPGDGVFNLKLENNINADYELKVYNTVGTIVYQEILHKEHNTLIHEINLTRFPSGAYTVILRDAKNKPLHVKLIKL